MLYRSSQKSWGVKKITETTVHGIGCLKMRLDHRTGRNIFGTINIPVINSKDPLSAKIIRNAHLANREGPGVIHNLAKMTKANLVRGQLATYWRGQRREIDRVIHECDIYRGFDERSCRPEMGRSLFRCKVGTSPFQHCRLILWEASESCFLEVLQES